MSLKPIKTKTGFVEVYDDGKKIGLCVVRKSPDYSFYHIDAGASTELTPKQARKVADQLIAWADRNKS